MSTLERVFEVNLIGFGRWIKVISNFTFGPFHFAENEFFFPKIEESAHYPSIYQIITLIQVLLKGQGESLGWPLERIPPADEDAGTSCGPLQHPLVDLLSFFFLIRPFSASRYLIDPFFSVAGVSFLFPIRQSALSTSADRLLIRPVHHC
jgi:hypothetical protein